MARYDGHVKFDARIDSKKFKDDLDSVKSVSKKAFTAIGLAAGAMVTGVAAAGISFESAWAGVRKTVNATTQELEALKDGIRDMGKTIPLAANEIAGIAEAAGQLGIKTENILEFTRTMADLGVATNLAGEEAASTLAKFANITNMSQKNFSNLGSTIVALGNNLATTEADIAEMAIRMAGAGTQAGLTEAQILAFSGALSSIGMEAQAGGSAFSMFITDMQLAVETGNSSLKDFAKVAGMSVEKFKNEFQTNAAGAILAFIKGLNDTERNGKSATAVLADMGITELNLSRALKGASEASDVFANAVELGNTAWKENNALTKEAEQRYQTTESKLKILGNQVKDLGITAWDSFSGQFGNGIDAASDKIEELSASMENGKLKDALGNVGDLFGEFVDSATSLASGVLPPLISVLGFLGENIGVVSTAIGIGATAFLGYKTVTLGAAAAQGVFNAVATASPLGLVGAAVGVVAFSIVKLSSVIKENTQIYGESFKAEEAKIQKLKEEKAAVEDLQQAAAATANAEFAKIDVVQKLADELSSLADETGHVHEADKARAQYILGELNDALGTEYSMTGNTIVQYEKLRGEINTLIATKRAEALIDSNKLVYQEALEGQQKKLNELAQQKALIDKTIADYSAKAAEKRKAEQNGEIGRATELQTEMDALAEVLQEQEKTYGETEAQLLEYGETLDKVDSLTSAMASGSAEEINDAISGFFANVKSGDEILKTSSDAIADAGAQLTELKNKYQIAKDLYAKGLIDKGTLDSAKSNLISAAESYSEVGGNITDGILAGLDISDEELYSRLSTIAGEGIATADGVVIEASPKTGENFARGFASGINDYTYLVTDAASDMANAAATAANTKLDVNSPSKVMRDGAGLAYGEGFAAGITKSTPLVTKAATELGDKSVLSLKESIDSHSPAKDTEKVGDDFDAGFANGIENGTPMVTEAAEELGYSAADALEQTINASSFSNNLSKSLEKGLKENAEKMTERFENAVKVLDVQLDFGIISEEEYYQELKRLRDKYLTEHTKEWYEATLEIHDFEKKAAKESLEYRYDLGIITERQYYEALEEYRDKYFTKDSDEWRDHTLDIFNYYKEEALKAFEDVADKQERMRDKLSDYGSLTKTVTVKNWNEDGSDLIWEELTDFDKNLDVMKGYADNIDSISERMKNGGFDADSISTFKSIFADLSVDKGASLAKLLTGATDEKFYDYINGYLETLNTAEYLSKQIYSDEFEAAADDAADVLTKAFEAAGYEVPKGFFDIGNDSAEEFSSGFLNEIGNMLQPLRDAILSCIPKSLLSFAGNPGGQQSYTANYNFYSSGDTTAQQIQAAQAASERDRLSGGY